MLPADEGLCSDDFAALEIDLRLEVQKNFVFFEPFA